FKGDAIELAPDGSFALVVAGPGDTGIGKIDLKTGTNSLLIGGTSPIGSFVINDLALKGDTSEVISLWAINASSSIQRLRLSDNLSSVVTHGINPVGLAIEGDGSTILATDNALFSSLYRID